MAVYFIQAADSGFIKIGRAADPRVRLAQMQTGCWEDLILIAVQERGSEQALHRRFAHLRHRGEWFKPGSELLSVVAKYRVEHVKQEHIPGQPTCSGCHRAGHTFRICPEIHTDDAHPLLLWMNQQGHARDFAWLASFLPADIGYTAESLRLAIKNHRRMSWEMAFHLEAATGLSAHEIRDAQFVAETA